MERRERLRRLTYIACAAAIILAPFLALLWSVEAGLALMAIALTACGLLLHGAKAEAPQRLQSLIRAVVMANLALAGACAVALVYLLTR
jgi:hypothetical protein